MPTEQPNCLYRKLFVEKRKGARLIYDLSVTIGFTSSTRWVDPKNYDNVVEFGLTRADFHLKLTNGSVDLKEGDKLGGELQLDAQKKISTVIKAEGKKTKTKIGAAVSLMAPSVRIDSGGDEHQKGSKYSAELQAFHLTVYGNLSNPERPFWTFIPVEGCLSGKLTAKPLCTVKVKEKSIFTYSDEIIVHMNDIDITCMPKKWTDNLPFFPFKGLRVQKIKCRIIDAMYENEEMLKMKRT